ncbi:MAG: hypothetical protein J6Y24_07455 [Bacteroidales bacterium]|nr:hypothetical protein [Bacteroidales bacterium]
MQKFIKKIAIASIITSILGVLFMLPCFYILPYQTGDLGRLGGIPFGPYDTIFKVPIFLYTENIMDYDSLQNVEILTIGDSFSQGYQIGYQNFLGRYLNKKVSNFRVDGFNPIQTAVALIEKQMIPNCKIIILETVERYMIANLTQEITITEDIYKRTILSGSPAILFPEDTIIRHSDYNFKRLTSYYKTKFFSSSKYKELTLSTPMFTAGKYSHSLYIYNNEAHQDGDLRFKYITESQIQKAKDKVSELKTIGASNNIQIIYLVAADKYDMYYDYIKDNPYPINPILSSFSEFDSTFFVNTKTILLPYLKNGEKDIYRVNDTHWSVKAAEIIGNHLGRIINNTIDLSK